MQRSELKKHYDALSLTQLGLEKREKLSLQIHYEKKALQEAMISLPKILVEEQEMYRSELKQRSTCIEEMEKELRSYDHVLDSLEGVSADQIKEQLIRKVLEEIPESAESYEKISVLLEQLDSAKKAIELLQEQLSPLFEALRDGARARQKRSFFAFIFGHNPKMILARAIQNGIIAAEKIVEQVNEVRTRQLVECFLVEAKKPWNRALYSSEFFRFFDEVADLLAEFSEDHAKKEREITEALSLLEAWIERYS